MADRVRRRAWTAALAASATTIGLVLALALAGPTPGRSQVMQPVPNVPFWGGESTWANNFFSGMNKPMMPRQGDWAEVIMVNGRWMVLQNAAGQQYPLAFEAIRNNQFFARWPIRIDLAAPDALVEATGSDLGSNVLQTDQVDVYEGGARNLVSPAWFNLSGANRQLTWVDANQAPAYGQTFPFSPMEGLNQRIHIVGPVVGLGPLQLLAPGNFPVTVTPSPDGINVTQVTLGAPALVKKGDLVYVIADRLDPKTVTAARVVLYKSMPLAAYTGN
jgi:hypothetical protein